LSAPEECSITRNRSGTEEGKGTGVGLYMARSIVHRNMRGKLSVANVAEGAGFKIVIQGAAA